MLSLAFYLLTFLSFFLKNDIIFLLAISCNHSIIINIAIKKIIKGDEKSLIIYIFCFSIFNFVIIFISKKLGWEQQNEGSIIRAQNSAFIFININIRIGTILCYNIQNYYDVHEGYEMVQAHFLWQLKSDISKFKGILKDTVLKINLF